MASLKQMAAAALAFVAGVSGGAAEIQPDGPETLPSGGEWPTAIWHTSGKYALGINDAGHLNYQPPGAVASVQGTRPYGARFIDVDNELGRGANVHYEATSSGAPAEGWGASYYTGNPPTLQQTGYANQHFGGTSNVVAGALDGSAACMSSQTPANCQWATATATIGCIEVKHAYYPSPDTEYAFLVDVNITNNCADAITRLRYNRVMDWDIEPERTAERVINNPGNAADLACVSNGGVCRGDPEEALVSCNRFGSQSVPVCAPAGGGEFDHGVDDHGARFEFDFADVSVSSPLAPGATRSFTTVYGASATSAGARGILSTLKAEAYSLGVLGSDPAGITHFFGFTGVGGTVAVCSSDEDCASDNFCDGAFSCVNPGTATSQCVAVSRCPPSAGVETYCCEEGDQCVTCPLGVGLIPGTCSCDTTGDLPVFPCDCGDVAVSSETTSVSLSFSESPTATCS